MTSPASPPADSPAPLARDQEVTLTLSAEEWDALIGTGERHWAGHGSDRYRSVRAKVIEATPGEAERRQAALAEACKDKPELDWKTRRDLGSLARECINAFKSRARIPGQDWDHLGMGAEAPGGRLGPWRVVIRPELPHMTIYRDTPFFDGERAYGFTDAEREILRRMIGRKLIAKEWGGQEFVSFRLKLSSPTRAYEDMPAFT